MPATSQQRKAVPERTASILHYLEGARNAVASARRLLDTSSSACGACGRKWYTAWPEKQADMQLSTMEEKLRRLTATLGGVS